MGCSFLTAVYYMDSSPLPAPPLPVSWGECKSRGWSSLDILLITGDAYVDHPSYGVALIGRLLEQQGYKVAVLSQPRFDSNLDFKKFPQPDLFCGITGGCLDSIVANYSGNGKVRNSDAYSPNGNPWRGKEKSKGLRCRPDRATLIYTSLAKSTYKDVPIVLGGVEASLRRFVHYDYKQDKLRGSFLTDAKADILVYGMGEKAVIEIANRLKNGRTLDGIAGTCRRYTDTELQEVFPELELKNSREVNVLPSQKDISTNKDLFLEAEIEIDKNLRANSSRILMQKQQSHWVMQNPSPTVLLPAELDNLYHLPFSRLPNPNSANIPAHKMIEHSVTVVRGCSGNCSFCAITRHQGPAIVSRSKGSILKECEQVSKMASFKGTISDLGGPTANLYGTKCTIGSCKKHDFLYPKVCPNLRIDEDLFIKLLKETTKLQGVKHVFISSGLRMELLLRTPKLLKMIIKDHTPGSLKIAPEHSDDELLCLMHKEPHSLLKKFIKECRKIEKELGKKIELTPYIITAHPGATTKSSVKLVKDMKNLGLIIRKSQDFTPTPGTLSTAMFVSGKQPGSKKPLAIPRTVAERKSQRIIIEKELRLAEGAYGAKRRRKKQ